MDNNNNVTDLEYEGDIIGDTGNNNRCQYNWY